MLFGIHLSKVYIIVNKFDEKRIHMFEVDHSFLWFRFDFFFL